MLPLAKEWTHTTINGSCNKSIVLHYLVIMVLTQCTISPIGCSDNAHFIIYGYLATDLTFTTAVPLMQTVVADSSAGPIVPATGPMVPTTEPAVPATGPIYTTPATGLMVPATEPLLPATGPFNIAPATGPMVPVTEPLVSATDHLILPQPQGLWFQPQNHLSQLQDQLPQPQGQL